MDHNDLCVGIDLGTTNSVIATCRPVGNILQTPVSDIYRDSPDFSNRRTIPKIRGKLLPSLVYYHDVGDEFLPIAGDIGKRRILTAPYSVAQSIKSQMGQPRVSIDGNWDSQFPDQRPEEVSSRILRCMLDSLELEFDERITDAVITVPASFGPAQREATLLAAEMAGLDVREPDGSFRDDVLLSEPEAVVYHVINQLQSGDINIRMDFFKPRNVLVFDIGGGTLDVTLHKVQQLTDDSRRFEIQPLATNRFSTIAGDQFDESLARWMYDGYLDGLRRENSAAASSLANRPEVRRVFKQFAERLKIDVSSAIFNRSLRGGKLKSTHMFPVYGDIPGGYDYDTEISLEEFEKVLTPLLGPSFQYEDYRRFESITDGNNIIYPLLDVLSKAARKVAPDEVTVDAVILNGGMSQLYLIKERLADFFGMRPITLNDPDTSVAQGAVVYHYYLHQDDTARQLHRMFMEESAGLAKEEHEATGLAPSGHKPEAARTEAPPTPAVSIRSTGSVLPESLFLDVRGAEPYLIAESGVDLPYKSPAMSDFRILPGQSKLIIPILQKKLGGGFQTIARGEITFREALTEDRPVAIRLHVRRNGTLTLDAWTYHDREHLNPIEHGSFTLSFGENSADNGVKEEEGEQLHFTEKLLPPSGPPMEPRRTLSLLLESVAKGTAVASAMQLLEMTRQRKELKEQIISCVNPQDFAEPMLAALTDATKEINMNFLPVARKLALYWSDRDRALLTGRCLETLRRELSGQPVSGLEVTANGEAIKTIGMWGDAESVRALAPLKAQSRYRDSLLFAYGRAGAEAQWVVGEFKKTAADGKSAQSPLLSLLSFCRVRNALPAPEASEMLNLLAAMIPNTARIGQGSGGRKMHVQDLPVAIVTMGQIYANCLRGAGSFQEKALNALNALSENAGASVSRAKSVAEGLINGSPLSQNDERFLLSLMEKGD